VQRPTPHPPGPGQESVWGYPRPPRVEQVDERVVVTVAGTVVAETDRPLRVLETSHPPVYYVPREDVRADLLRQASRMTVCEFKGMATYWDVVVGDRVVRQAGWSYPDPAPGYEALRDAVAFYPQEVDEASVDGEVVQAVEGSFYGGWITSRVAGPFKGGPGTMHW
jgi:uncharacterized protein (DUF427 family)